MGCKKAQGFLERTQHEIGSLSDANKEKRGRAEALALAKSAARVVVGRGKKVLTIDMKMQPPDDETLAGLLLGPTGNLKAPTLRIGNTLVVGFSEEAYKLVLGA
jgi:hypothetical protein